MKVLSVLLMGLVFCANFTVNKVFAQDKSFVVSSANVVSVCLDEIRLTNNSISINKQFHMCPQTTSTNGVSGSDEEYASTLGDVFKDKIFYFIGTSTEVNGGLVRSPSLAICTKAGPEARYECRFNPIETTENHGSWYSCQYFLASKGLNSNALSSAPLNRLFIAGTQGTAGANDYLGYAVNAENIPTGAKSIIFSNPNNKTTLGGSVSRDGGMAVQLIATSASWTFNTRKLNNGLPAKAPVSWTVPAYSGYSPDITNPIEVSSGVAGASALKIRYLVYRVFRGVGTAAQQSQIMIQAIDDATGKPMGAARPLTPFKNAFLAPAEAFQSIAIAPNGELMIFTEYSGACKKMILKAVKLVNGSVSGATKVLAGCGGSGQSPLGNLGIDIAEFPKE